jgi:FMN reductase
MANTPHIVGLGGTCRPESGTERAIRHVLRVCEERGATTHLLSGATLVRLPYYAPECSERTDDAKELVAQLRRADAVVLASSAYHGSIAGLVKNAIDYVQDMVNDHPPYLTGRPVGCIATGAGWQGAVATLQHLRTIVHALRGWPTPLGLAINTLEKPFTPDGGIVDGKLAVQFEAMVDELWTFVTR